jgi:hypothetical protein
MGRNLGYFDSDELDRPELNKCPDCECYFASEECPLCGKICPEDMRAGNRAPVKPPKKKKNSSGRVQFIPWYHTWWFILIMMYVMPVAGIILFFTSPHTKKSKIIAASIVVGAYLLLFAVGSGLLWGIFDKPPVNGKITRAEYVELCDDMSVADYYRDAYNEGNYVTLELTVEGHTDFGGDTYYICSDRKGGDLMVYVADYSVDKQTNYLKGDMIRVYGECSGYAEFYLAETEGLPLLYMAYSELIG